MRKFSQGFTMVETLVALAILGVFFTAVVTILGTILENVGESRVRTTALALAQTKMETVRNLPYDSVGTVGGIPQGSLQETEIVTINNLPFTVTTSVVYIDDPFDGLTPSDITNTDYKRARIQVTWGGAYPSHAPVTLVSNIVPKGVETVTSGGTLQMQVFDGNGLPVSGATVTIDNTQVTPEIHLQTLTDSDGILTLPGSPACITCYRISVTKTNFSIDRTYSTQEVANPQKPYASVFDGQVTQISFSIDHVSTLVVKSYGSRESGFPPVANVQFIAKGSKIIGYDTDDEPVLKYTNATNTGGGTITLSGLEWDTYTLDFSSSGHSFAGSNPILPVAVPPATNITLSIVAVPKSTISFLVAVKNSAQELLASASAKLTNTNLSYDVTVTSGATSSPDFGQAYFGSLSSGDYNLTVDLDGYEEATSSLTLTSTTQETVVLNSTQ